MAEIGIIGAGSSGLFAAARLISGGCGVTLFEHNDITGKKLLITGKGRCNVTNNCTTDDFLNNVVRNRKFLFSAANAFSPADTMKFFEDLGVPLKTERGGRVFPVSDHSSDIVSALSREAKMAKLIRRSAAEILQKDGVACGVLDSAGEKHLFDAVILCTGGASYKSTGSDGSGYALATCLGHTVTELTPSLIPVVAKENYCRDMMGLSLKNVKLSLYENGKCTYEDFGEMLFTHFGISGPMVLSASAHIKDTGSDIRFSVDMKPALDEKQLERRILRDFDENLNKEIRNVLGLLLPSKMVSVMLRLCNIPFDTKINSITREMRNTLIKNIKAFPITFAGFRPLDEAIITRGGINVREIGAGTMESKLVKHLYFAGEIIDCDAYTGGFNLQIAFSTAYLAASAILNEINL